MPELPDLEVIKDFLQERIVGRRIEGVEVLRPIVIRNLTEQDFSAALVGRELVGIRRRGKFLILILDSGDILAINPMLAGRLHYCPPGQRRHARTYLILHLAGSMDLRYVDPRSMGKIYLTADLALVPGFATQGPEVLDPALSREVFAERLRRHRGEIKGVLTNQRFVAGIGNAYADEILFRAGIYPFRKRPSLSVEEIEALYEAMRSVLTEATAILRERVGEEIHVEWRDFLQVHGKGGSPCPRCGTAISEIRANRRITNFCRRCQPGTLTSS
ncbi:MAG: Fpg/Nei family DNA glycosylase [Anaerolineae bacterium]